MVWPTKTVYICPKINGIVSGTIVAGDMSSHKINYGKHFYMVPIEESTHSTLCKYNGDHYQQVFGNKTTITM